ncbi:MAG: phosphate ABC transporter substrate-binding protein [Sphingomonas sp. SCN 67-18]|uniref:substrate-binding domain-containing protein n=1 Tax=uncultured Sphingomonas sp. TaxID=158754 RepID=UPI00086CC704|nr:substrate-binding domain-containing protein [Sphingomonas sp. SCN 67-18]ODU20833.1 MAG: phosphate ABC transporter substrate-binding protein [Sphingomonas sp. SCN 67-18]
MKMVRTIAILLASTLMLSACQDEAGGGAAGGGARDQIKAVGSSTVYPFTTAVAEQFVNNHPGFKSPIVESTGTGAGMKLFCAGVGAAHPDIENASRRMKASEYEDCKKNGVGDIVEIQVGIDGVAFAESLQGPKLKLTIDDIYKAVAANPYGKPNAAKTWKDVNPALPAIAIQVYGPPSTSGTRDALTELIMAKACEADPAMKAMKESDADKAKDICHRVREDGIYVDAGENDNLIVQKLGANPNAIGIFGYSFLEENGKSLQGIPVGGIAPSYATISDFSYPGARPLYIYVKAAHLKAIPGLREFVGEYASAWGPDGYLTKRGLIAAPEDVRAANAKTAAEFTLLDPSALK